MQLAVRRHRGAPPTIVDRAAKLRTISTSSWDTVAMGVQTLSTTARRATRLHTPSRNQKHDNSEMTDRKRHLTQGPRNAVTQLPTLELIRFQPRSGDKEEEDNCRNCRWVKCCPPPQAKDVVVFLSFPINTTDAPKLKCHELKQTDPVCRRRTRWAWGRSTSPKTRTHEPAHFRSGTCICVETSTQ